jgi:hypothetical protein
MKDCATTFNSSPDVKGMKNDEQPKVALADIPFTAPERSIDPFC